MECNHGLSWHEIRNATVEARTEGLKMTFDDPKRPWDCEGHLFQNSMEKSYGFRVSFLNAFIRRLSERLDEERARVLEEAAATGQALVRINNTLAKVDEWIGEQKVGKAAHLSRQWHHNPAGAARGKAVAEGVNLRANTVKTTTTAPKQIG
jgi:hypothetical protein